MKIYVCFLQNDNSRQQHETAHSLLRFALRKDYGVGEYSLKKGIHGKPYLEHYPNIHINLSHTKGLVVCAVGENTIGVDCEHIRDVRENVIKRVCKDFEAQAIAESDNPRMTFTRLWTLKESFTKAMGIGVSYHMKKSAFKFEDDVIYTNVRGAVFRQWVLQDRYVITLCMAQPERDVKLEFLNL